MLSVVILSYNRREALRRTLGELRAQGLFDSAQIIVVDNASSDGSPDMVRAEFPACEVLALTTNAGVAGFNRGAERARGDMLLILDDDAWPEPDALVAALEMLRTKPATGAVALLPKHPVSQVEEWRHEKLPQSRWPVMGCGNLIRTEVWRAVGGYEEGFFLYRNDTDLALKLLAAGFDVWFDPTWIVWHDSPGASRKSDRWLTLATRNWVWLARRHGRRFSKRIGALAGIAWAVRLAGLSPRRQWLVARGAWTGCWTRPPQVPAACHVDGKAFRDLVKRQVGGRWRARRPV
ncbi:MAG TPA: glycosyltransferase family 2 protein [Phycisphaerales bacterium]|nr:glycosyltransferase family 2 protein [Phycisphaerales bacterium]